MANIPRRRLGALPGMPPPSRSFSPFKEIGASGVAVFGGRIMTRERNRDLIGQQRWMTYGDMVANTSIVAAGVRYFLNIVSAAKWTVTPPDDTPAAKEVAEMLEEIIHSMNTPWRRVVRRAASYRFMGFGIQEWTAIKRDDGIIALQDIESRPQHTVERWDVDDQGTVQGVWQSPPQTGDLRYLPRQKIIYMVEDSLTDSPEGLGLYRHLVEPYKRLQKYLTLEGRGFERDLRGTPIGRVPYTAINAAVTAGSMTQEQANQLTSSIENFVKIQSKSEDTSLVLDSAPYVVQTDSGKQISGVQQYGLDLLTGQSPDFSGLQQAIERLNREMARVIGAEHLLLGGEGGANRALAEDKSRNFYQVVNGTLDDICDATTVDVIENVCNLNGIPDELRPEVTHSDISFRSVAEVTASLRDMATAGAVLTPDDPAINDVRDMLGISQPPERTPAELAAMTGLNPDGTPIEEEVPPGGEKPPAEEEEVPA